MGFDAGVVKELSKEGEEPKTGVGKLVTESGGVCKVKTLQTLWFCLLLKTDVAQMNGD